MVDYLHLLSYLNLFSGIPVVMSVLTDSVLNNHLRF